MTTGQKTGKLMQSMPPGPLCLATLTLHAMSVFSSALIRYPVTTFEHFSITSSFSSSNTVYFLMF